MKPFGKKKGSLRKQRFEFLFTFSTRHARRPLDPIENPLVDCS